MQSDPTRDLLAEPRARGVAEKIDDRLSQELVLALVGPVGSGVSTAASFLVDILKQDYSYEVAPIIKLSDIIFAEAHRVGVAKINREPLSAYVDQMQTAGNLLRDRFGANYLAEKAIERIVTCRKQSGGYHEDVHVPGRRAYILDSIKNVEELTLLRQVYAGSLVLLGVFAPDDIRKERLRDNSTAIDVDKIVARDQGEVATFGQMTRKVFVKSDFFIRNDQKKDQLRAGIVRYLEILFGAAIHTPKRDESAMYKAKAVASNSACMSRQVGAAIVSESGELIGVGWNDVPKFGGGLYSEDDQSVTQTDGTVKDLDHRCFNWDKGRCHNETRRDAIIAGIVDKVMKSNSLKRGTKQAEIEELLEGTAIDALTEFSRSIHAEMEAILSVAREGRHSLRRATLYTTTYPCHNCARHIVASGISAVVYIEPYAKSLATTLHCDAISESPSPSKVVFRLYEGVAPRNFLRLFQPSAARKQNGRIDRPDKKKAMPLFRAPLDGPVDYESKVIADLTLKEQSPEIAAAGGRK